MRPLGVLIAVTVILVSALAWADVTVPVAPEDPMGTVTAKVSLATQTMYVYVGGTLAHSWPVSTARRGYKTPLGDYAPYLLSKNHRSKIYANAPMPYSVFFLGNYAVHGTTASKALGRPASHGCVRLLTENARILYTLVQWYGKQNVRIVIEA